MGSIPLKRTVATDKRGSDCCPRITRRKCTARNAHLLHAASRFVLNDRAAKGDNRVAKQHGHSITTMLRAYAAWAEGAVEADIQAIKGAMAASPVREGLEFFISGRLL